MLKKIGALAVLALSITLAPSLAAAPDVKAAAPVTPSRPTAAAQARPAAKPTGVIAAGTTDGPAFADVDAPNLGKVSADRFKAHAIRPANVIGVESDKGLEGLTFSKVLPSKIIKLPPQPPKLDLNLFNQKLTAALGSTFGFIAAIRKGGQPVYARIYGQARGPLDTQTNWSGDVRMHVASVSKFITAVSMVKALDAKGISVDAKILPYLPAAWVKGTNVDKVTFRDLLRHTSGFKTGGSDSDWETMRFFTMIGAIEHGEYNYENMNFGLCRILQTVLLGFPNTMPFNAATWDALTIDSFRKYTQDNVFTPSNVPAVSFAPVVYKKDALAYASKTDATGWNSGDLASMAGGAAFRLSLNELLDFMGTFRRKGTIVSTARAQQILDQGLGLDVVDDTAIGRVYDKNGRWRNNGNTEQSIIMFLPEDMELAVFVNSPIDGGNVSVRGAVRSAYDQSVK
jgi:CubicO group peptidase (beta-lactamase class C family)